MLKNEPSETGYRRIRKAQMTDRIQGLQNSFDGSSSSSLSQQAEVQTVLHEIEVYQTELDMQNHNLRELQKAQEDSLERYVSLYDFAPTGYVTLNNLGMVTDINLTLASMLDVERQSIIGRSFSSFILPADLKAFRSHTQKYRAMDGPITAELRLVRRDKSIIYVELRSARCTDPTVLENQFRSSVTDISARKNAEEERDRFFDLSTDLLSFAGTDGYFKRVNPAWEKAVGYTCQELLDHPFLDFIHPDDREAVTAQLMKVQRNSNSTVFETRFVKKDRSVIWLTWKSVLANDVFYSVARDTTSEHQEKIEIENEQNWLREMIEAIPSAVLLVDIASEKVISISSGVYELAGAESKDLQYISKAGFSCEDENGNVLKGDSLPTVRAARGEKFNGEGVVWRTPKGTVHLRVFSRQIPSKYGRPAMVLLMSQDVTNLKKTELSLVTAITKLEQEREMRERFVSTLTHDLRTPLCAVKMGTELILRSNHNAKIVEQLAEQILESSERLDYMISDLLDANRISAGETLPIKPVACDLVAITKTTLKLLTAIHGDRFKIKGVEKCAACLDVKLMNRVIENLCTNAVKYGSPNSSITITIEKTIGHLLLSVHNDGPMISMIDQATLFEPFRRTSSAQESGKKGWGIGLTLIRGIAESHGGRVYLVSEDQKGTTFTVELPLT